MLTEQRQEMILQMLEEKGSITVGEIREKFDSSESTIRRDLNYLDSIGKLTKVFGGAVLRENRFITKELSVSQKSLVNIEAKTRVAQYAAQLIEADDFVYIDAGTTTECMISYITERNATYVTNAVAHAKILANAGFKVILVGGELKGTTEAVVGVQAVVTIQGYHFSKGFFGTNGISIKSGYTTPDYSEALVKKTALHNCQKCYILADNTKFGETSSVTFADIGDAEIITDGVPSEHYRSLNNIITV
ncbi:MAG: DeoR/GlpR family DNA-binding transcription regulator [Butyrivibrio sp.]|nr:DeoR/GlpR family DNA-binding transcription regulator [Butyrivibrio sp.]